MSSPLAKPESRAAPSPVIGEGGHRLPQPRFDGRRLDGCALRRRDLGQDLLALALNARGAGGVVFAPSNATASPRTRCARTLMTGTVRSAGKIVSTYLGMNVKARSGAGLSFDGSRQAAFPDAACSAAYAARPTVGPWRSGGSWTKKSPARQATLELQSKGPLSCT
jgi:hypothetical protein